MAGYVPRDTILDSGALKVMVSEVEVQMGVTRKKVEFVISWGTPREHQVSLQVIALNTTTYNALLGMEFLAAMGGGYDTYAEIYTCRQGGLAHSKLQLRAILLLPFS